MLELHIDSENVVDKPAWESKHRRCKYRGEYHLTFSSALFHSLAASVNVSGVCRVARLVLIRLNAVATILFMEQIESSIDIAQDIQGCSSCSKCSPDRGRYQAKNWRRDY